jgi:hypothetical protein
MIPETSTAVLREGQSRGTDSLWKESMRYQTVLFATRLLVEPALLPATHVEKAPVGIIAAR